MIIIFFIGAFLAAAIWSIYYEKNWNKDVTGQFSFKQDYVYEGEQAQLLEIVENRKWMPLPILEVSFRIRKEMVFHDMENTHVSDLTYKRDVFSLVGNQRITRQLVLDCKKRGYYQIDKIELATHSLLYKNKYVIDKSTNTHMHVYAKRTDISEILMTYEKMMGSLQCEKRLYDDPFAFRSIREYTTTDPMKAINWKASAKTGELMVNTFDSTILRSIMICLDVEDGAIIKSEHLIEECISVAASLAQKMISKGMEVGLSINAYSTEDEDNIHIEPNPGKGQLSKIERILSERRSNEKTCEFQEILKRLPNDTYVVLISKNASLISEQMMEQHVGKEQAGLWILPINRNEECEIKLTGNLRLVKREVSRS